MAAKVSSISDYRDGLSPEQFRIVELLRAMAQNASAGVSEHIKWNAPSFCIGGDDRITLGSDPKGRIRVILHRGAKVRTADGFSFAAPGDLIVWAAFDRGVMTFASIDHLEARQDEVRDIFHRWLEATA